MTSKRDNLMRRVAFCFPGQLQEKPALKEDHPLRKTPHFKEWVERASHQTTFDLLSFSFKGEEAGFNLKLQIATYLLSMIHFFRLRAEGWVPDIITEHSMGIYAALAASEAITFEEGLWVTESIGRILEREGASSRGAMASIVGLPFGEIEKIRQDLNGFHLSVANHNGSMHFVLSGEEKGIEKALDLALARKAISAMRLTFNIGLHSPSLSVLSGEISALLREIEIRSPKFPIVNHWTIRPLKQEEIKDFLSQEIGQPVYWDQCVEKLILEGVDQFIEVGHGATLTKLIRWINREVEAFSAGDRVQTISS
ncbi:MAG: ACP S-malonyltransferase [Deltaproteobacteria bacterium]|nr:ACP S-malonyltransferase [Deltaproteobacteria bacterium]MBM4346887.1 ACP S-malonyltransferase [Deltaproteobacteria bacterium]